MYHTSSFLEDLFFPNRNRNLKRIIVLSSLTGVLSAAIGNFFAKRENRYQLRMNLDRLGYEVESIKDKLTHQAKNFGSDVKEKTYQAEENMRENMRDQSKKKDYSGYKN